MLREIMCFIRPNKVNETKRALADSGFPAFTCRKCLGRGKKSIDPKVVNSVLAMSGLQLQSSVDNINPNVLDAVLATGEIPVSPVGESLTESSRLIAKRFFTLIVDDKDVDKAVKTVIAVNQTGNPGDGKIFVLPILETYSVRTGEGGDKLKGAA